MAVPMAWPTYSRTTENPAASATSWTARPTSWRRLPERSCSIPAHRLCSVTSISRVGLGRDLPDTHGVGGVAVVALDDGPAVDRDDVALVEDDRLAGMPCTIIELGEVQITAGKPW